MKAVCVNEKRALEIREVPVPTHPPSGHVLVKMEASAINHGDKAFLARPMTAAGLNTSAHDIWGASGSGRVLAAGADVPSGSVGRNVALYRSLTPSPHTVGLWSEFAVLPYTSCVLLPDHVEAMDYSGSLVNVITAYAFLEEIAAEGHTGVVVTAGSSATGLAMAVLAKARSLPAIFLARSPQSQAALRALEVEYALDTSDPDFYESFRQLAERLKTTAVFDGVGGELTSSIAPHLPANPSVSIYGFLGGNSSISLPTALFMTKNLTMKRFSNFSSATVRDPNRLRDALDSLAERINHPLFRTKIGRTFRFEQIDEAMAYERSPGEKAVLVAG